VPIKSPVVSLQSTALRQRRIRVAKSAKVYRERQGFVAAAVECQFSHQSTVKGKDKKVCGGGRVPIQSSAIRRQSTVKGKDESPRRPRKAESAKGYGGSGGGSRVPICEKLQKLQLRNSLF